MQHESHPHDERLAALAGADRDAIEDRALREHLASCERCRAVVDDLALLRSALAELPDLRPSRPLQLIPPVAARASGRGGALGLLRRLTAPALAAGAALILVGAVGSTGILNGFASMGAAGAPAFENVGDDLTAEGSAVPAAPVATEHTAAAGLDGVESASAPESPSPGARLLSPQPSTKGSVQPTRDGNDDSFGSLSTPNPPNERLPWLLVLGSGVVLAGGSLLLRFTVQPRAG